MDESENAQARRHYDAVFGIVVGENKMKTHTKKNILLFCILIFVVGCVQADEISQLVTDLSNTNRLWSWNSGTTFNIHLPEAASTNDVINRIFEMSRTKDKETNYKILEVRQVRIPNGLRPDVKTYTAAIVLKDDRKKIVLFSYWGPAFGWWSRVYDSKSEAIGSIDLSMRGAKCESKFAWPINGNPKIVMECSDVNAEPLLTRPHVPFVIQVEITDEKNSQIVVSNSTVQVEMFYDSISVPSFTIRTDDYTNAFQRGHPYIFYLFRFCRKRKGLDMRMFI